MHAKPDLRVFLKWMIAGSGSVITDVIRLNANQLVAARMAKPPSSHMSVGRGRFRKSLRAVLLSRQQTPNLEELVREELGWNCIYCAIPGGDERLQLDHLWPEATGGCLVIGNVAPACPTCNSDRRDLPWREFFRTSNRVQRNRSNKDVEAEIHRIEAYMKKHGQETPPTLESTLAEHELELLANFDTLLDALSDGALAKNGYIKPSAINFDHPALMFDELVEVARKYQRNGNRDTAE